MTVGVPGPSAPALASLIDRHAAELCRHVTALLGREDDAEDVLQEVWMAAHRRPPEGGPGSNVRAWLYRVATNAALSRLARDRRRRAALLGQRFRVTPEGRPDPDAGLDDLPAHARARVREHVARLPRKQREAVWLRWAVGADYREIAQRLNCSEESARANVYSGMKRLRRELFDLWKKEYTR